MKRNFLLMFAMVLPLAVNAQTKTGVIRPVDNDPVATADMVLLSPSGERNNAPQRKIRVDEGESLMGYYTTDDLLYATAMNIAGTYYVADLFDDQVVTEFMGGQIMRFRFGIAYPSYVYSAFIFAQKDGALELEASVDINETIGDGWYDVELPTPVTIMEGYSYLIGYQYEQETVNESTLAGYSLYVDYGMNKKVSSNYFYYSRDGGYTWYSYYDEDALCIQAVVREGTFAEYDLALNNLTTDSYLEEGKTLSYSFQIRSNGQEIPSSYVLNVAVDGNVVETLDTPVAVTSNYQTISRTLSLSGYSSAGHTLSVSVDKINGETPTENTYNDVVETSFYIIGSDMPDRQYHLIENFTAVGCTNCPYGHQVIQKMIDNYPNKYLWICIHYNYNGTDPYYMDSTVNNIFNFAGADGYPEAAFSRALLTHSGLGVTNQMAIPIGYYASQDLVATYINDAVDNAFNGIPAFATVNIATEFDSDTRELKITVSGDGGTGVRNVLADNLLTVYITEDGLVGEQLYAGSWVSNYTHNNVLRAIPQTYSWGEDIKWTSDSHYSNSMTYTLDKDWNADNMYVTAFISGPMAVYSGGTWVWGDTDNGKVNNANRAKVGGVSEGISAVTTSGEDLTRTYYTIDGRQLSAPTKGVNIVRFSDGTSKKLLVK